MTNWTPKPRTLTDIGRPDRATTSAQAMLAKTIANSVEARNATESTIELISDSFEAYSDLARDKSSVLCLEPADEPK